MRTIKNFTEDIANGLVTTFTFLNEVRTLGLLRSDGTIVLDDGETYGGINDTLTPAGYIRYSGSNNLATYAVTETGYSTKPQSTATVPLRLVVLHNCDNSAEFEMAVVSYLKRHTFNTDNKGYSPEIQVDASDRDPERIFDAETKDGPKNMNARYKLLAVDFTLHAIIAFDECETFTCDGC